MKKIYVFLADGFEEVEALTVVDLLRRAQCDVSMVSVSGNQMVHSAHGIDIKADCLFDAVTDDADMLVLPGGLQGTANLKKHTGLSALVSNYNKAGKFVTAICAGPTVLGHFGLLTNKKACCYPNMEDGLLGADVSYDPVTVDGNIITGRGLGVAIPFALKLIEVLVGPEVSANVKTSIVF